MRYITLAIAFLICTAADAQIIRAEPFYVISETITKCFPAWDKSPYDTTDITATLNCVAALGGGIDTSFTTFGSISGTSKYYGGVLAPNGKIYCTPFNATSVLVIDPETNTTSTFGSISGTSKYPGGVLAPNGKIYCVPFNATSVLAIGAGTTLDPDFPLSRIFNKF